MQQLVNVGSYVLSYDTRQLTVPPPDTKAQKALEAKRETQKHNIAKLLSKGFLHLKNADTVTIRKTLVGGRTYYKIQTENAAHEVKGIIIKNSEDRKLIDAILDENGDPTELTLTHDKTSEQMRRLLNRYGEKDCKDVLYLWSSGGGGHKSAKEAHLEKNAMKLQEQILKKASSSEREAFKKKFQKVEGFTQWCKQMGIFHEADVLSDYLGSVGIDSANAWDEAQKAGNVPKQEFLASMQWLSDLFFGPFIFMHTLTDLIAHRPKQVVSTQAMATPAILLAMKIYNDFFKPKKDPPVILHLYMTDMPTELSGHFFNSLKNMWSIGGKEYLALHAPKPTDKNTWEMRAGLVNWQVEELETNDLPVRAAFIKAAEDFNKEDPIRFDVSGQEELNYLMKTLESQRHDPATLRVKGQTVEFTQKENDESFFLMLGSQPTKEAIKEYVDVFIEKASQDKDKNFQLFAFTGKFASGGADCFYKELCTYLKEQKPWPENLQVIPLSFQSPNSLVSLEINCHTITRSGGATIMELLVLEHALKGEKFKGIKRKQRLIHAEKIDKRSRVNCIPLWERGNFLHLQKDLKFKYCRAVYPSDLKQFDGKFFQQITRFA